MGAEDKEESQRINGSISNYCILTKPESRFSAGIGTATAGFLCSTVIGALGNSLVVRLGFFLVMLTVVLTFVPDVQKLITSGVLFSFGFLLVAFLTNDTVAILEVATAFFIMIALFAVKYGFPNHVRELISGTSDNSFSIDDFVDEIGQIPCQVRIGISDFLGRIKEIPCDVRIATSNAKYWLLDLVSSVEVTWANFWARFR